MEMRAVQVAEFGEPGVLKVVNDAKIPQPSNTQVLIRLRAIGVNPVDAYAREGKPVPIKQIYHAYQAWKMSMAACQMAHAYGLRVLGTAGTSEGQEAVLQNGADAVFNHTEAGYMEKILVYTGEQGPDIILEMLANVNLTKDMEIIKKSGTIDKGHLRSLSGVEIGVCHLPVSTNVYSGGRDYQIRPLMKKDHTTLNHLKRRTSAPRVDKDLLRKSVYMSNYRCYVPAAPAFNDVTRDEMLEIVERVRRPTEATQTRDARGDRNAIRPGNSSNDLAPKSQEDVNAIFTRVQRHTHMSRLRTVRHVANQPDRELTDVDI